MQFELYRKETARIAQQEQDKLAEAIQKLKDGKPLSSLEENGVLHSMQILAENAIGMAKHMLKNSGREVPVSGYDCFNDLAAIGMIDRTDLENWNGIIGLRNRIVHDYMNVDTDQVIKLVLEGRHEFIVSFLTRTPGRD